MTPAEAPPAHSAEDLQRIYRDRFLQQEEYRQAVWRVLIEECFHCYLNGATAILDLGCGYGEFINQVSTPERYAMDLNPDLPQRVQSAVKPLLQDCSRPWPLPGNSLDLVFTSNFFEHLPDKAALGRTLDEARRCLRPGGRLVALGPNVKQMVPEMVPDTQLFSGPHGPHGPTWSQTHSFFDISCPMVMNS